MKTRLFLSAFLTVVLTGCSGGGGGAGDPGDPGEQPPQNPADKYCTADMPNVWVFNRDASSTSFTLQTNLEAEDFNVTCSETWCTTQVQPTAKEDMKRLAVFVTEYDVRDANGIYVYDPPRTATLRIKGGGVFDRTITIAQNTNVIISTPLLPNTGFGDILYLSAAGETQEVAVTANCYRWKASTEATWLTVTQKDNMTLIVTSSERTGDTPRSATVTIVNESDKLNDRHTFTVADKDAVLTGSDYQYGEGTDWD